MSLTRTISPGHAVIVGLIWVNGPVLALLFSAIILPFGLWEFLIEGSLPQWVAVAICVVFALALWCAAWLWWSLNVPRWRLWSYRRVEDLARLQRQAVEAGLLWPAGHFFERTEIASDQLKADIRTAQNR